MLEPINAQAQPTQNHAGSTTGLRRMTFFLAERETALLRRIATRLPPWVRPNHLTGIGILGAVGTGMAYASTWMSPWWLCVASAMLAVNWFGDSLDGTLARVRKIERPRYGYYLDHFVDALNTAVVGVGIGVSPYVHMELALVAVVLYLTLSINVYLESTVLGVFKMAYGRFGPTEARLTLIAANTLGFVALAAGMRAQPALTNSVAGTLCAVMFGMLALRFGKNLQILSKLEPQRTAR
jgi:phosphatidylglycerophosphate synthase